jgi:8-oxo-dGTP pyrophosphatase MutT (NUDIX family)
VSNFRNFLKLRLTQELPGSIAQNKMRPYPKSYKNPTFKSYSPKTNSYRNSSVLALFTTWGDELEMLFTLRTAGIKHGGQISFPGGGREGNETHEQTALREAHEETGLIEANVDTVGRLSSLFVDHSNNMVVPVVGFLDEPQDFIANPNEVEEIFSVPFSKLTDEKHLKKEEWPLRDTNYIVPFWDVHKVPLWGATSMMLSELVVIYEEFVELGIRNS